MHPKVKKLVDKPDGIPLYGGCEGELDMQAANLSNTTCNSEIPYEIFDQVYVGTITKNEVNSVGWGNIQLKRYIMDVIKGWKVKRF